MQRKQKDDVYLLGKLSSLLFEEKIEANVPKKKKVKTKNIDEVNLRQEWLKLWDI
jgi:hypothetical protein